MAGQGGWVFYNRQISVHRQDGVVGASYYYTVHVGFEIPPNQSVALAHCLGTPMDTKLALDMFEAIRDSVTPTASVVAGVVKALKAKLSSHSLLVGWELSLSVHGKNKSGNDAHTLGVELRVSSPLNSIITYTNAKLALGKPKYTFETFLAEWINDQTAVDGFVKAWAKDGANTDVPNGLQEIFS